MSARQPEQATPPVAGPGPSTFSAAASYGFTDAVPGPQRRCDETHRARRLLVLTNGQQSVMVAMPSDWVELCQTSATRFSFDLATQRPKFYLQLSSPIPPHCFEAEFPPAAIHGLENRDVLRVEVLPHVADQEVARVEEEGEGHLLTSEADDASSSSTVDPIALCTPSPSPRRLPQPTHSDLQTVRHTRSSSTESSIQSPHKPLSPIPPRATATATATRRTRSRGQAEEEMGGLVGPSGPSAEKTMGPSAEKTVTTPTTTTVQPTKATVEPATMMPRGRPPVDPARRRLWEARRIAAMRSRVAARKQGGKS
ncbi:unnamed protein product [Tilletia controversa]|uniref:Uncharacterized protein n=3 Tax=Tilletia TaxID=13289 RepID=A0A8X7SZL1_9BASI|nr:hypothetical protein CF336_g2227 [Tilletia laevis]KAE8204068.1 hypothetical protein CF328_g1298 [Tilletia controversa]KAE8263430.1 hypothetical protein A4X03_0g1685 [Tilletia caries]KAE8253252.1 hypothetical protein A4X06_0g1590 [Tilletia controversa]CAD6893276.1 unnamed protein product [Tilletia caries]